MAVVLRDRRQGRRCGSVVADVLAPLRPRAHLPVPQANLGLDEAPPARTGGGRPLDLAHHRCPHPTPTGPPSRRGPAPSLGETTRHTRPADPRSHPTGLSEHPTDNRPSGRRTETLTTRPRSPSRITKHPTSPTTQPWQNNQNRHNSQGHEEASGLNNKLSRFQTPVNQLPGK
jgi:hypothetical protein